MLSVDSAPGQVRASGHHIFPEDLKNLAEDIKKLKELRDQILSGQHAFYSVSLDSRLGIRSEAPAEEAPKPTSLLHRLGQTPLDTDHTTHDTKTSVIRHEPITGVRRMESMIGRAKKRSLPDRLESDSGRSRSLQERRRSSKSPRPDTQSPGARPRDLSSRLKLGPRSSDRTRDDEYGRSRSPDGHAKENDRSHGRSVPLTAPPRPQQSYRERSPMYDDRPRTSRREGRGVSPVSFGQEPFSKDGYYARSYERESSRGDKFAKQRRSPSPLRTQRKAAASPPIVVTNSNGSREISKSSSHNTGYDTNARRPAPSRATDLQPSSSRPILPGNESTAPTVVEVGAARKHGSQVDVKTRLQQQRQQLQSRHSLTPEPPSSSTQIRRLTPGLEDTASWPARGSNSYSSSFNANVSLPSTSAPAASFGFPVTVGTRSQSPLPVQAQVGHTAQDNQWGSQAWPTQSNVYGLQPQWSASMHAQSAPSFQNFQQTTYPYSMPYQHSHPQSSGQYTGTQEYGASYNQYTQYYPSNAPYSAYQGPQ